MLNCAVYPAMGEIPPIENGSDLVVSIKALRPKTVAVISRLLNPPKFIPTEKGYLRFAFTCFCFYGPPMPKNN